MITLLISRELRLILGGGTVVGDRVLARFDHQLGAESPHRHPRPSTRRRRGTVTQAHTAASRRCDHLSPRIREVGGVGVEEDDELPAPCSIHAFTAPDGWLMRQECLIECRVLGGRSRSAARALGRAECFDCCVHA